MTFFTEYLDYGISVHSLCQQTQYANNLVVEFATNFYGIPRIVARFTDIDARRTHVKFFIF